MRAVQVHEASKSLQLTVYHDRRSSRELVRQLAVLEQGLPAMSDVSREDLSHWACFLLNPCQTFVESVMFDGESLVVDPQ